MIYLALPYRPLVDSPTILPGCQTSSDSRSLLSLGVLPSIFDSTYTFDPSLFRCDEKKCNKTFLYSSKSDSALIKCRTCKTETNVKEKYLLLSNLYRDFEAGISHMDSGDTDLAETILSAFVQEAFKISRPPNKRLALAQEALRCCWSSHNNMIYV